MIKTSRSLYALIAALITCSAVYAAPPKSAFVRIITMENSATIRDGRDDVLDSGGGTQKIVAIVAHRRGSD